MRLSAFAVIAASAVLAQVGAAPAPFRLLVVTSSVEVVSQFKDVRFGHAAPFIDRALLNSNNPPATSDNPTPDAATSKRLRHRKGCHGKKAKVAIFVHKIKIKAIKIGNCFRKALGWPLIEIKHHSHPHHGQPPHISNGDAGRDDFVSILPFPPVTAAKGGDWAGDMSDRPHHMHHKHHGTFLSRLHHSLMNLGRWEGRAVAFVIGCGIGVLIRMFWVLAIVSYRACRGHRDEGYATVAIMEEYDSDDETVISVPSPKLGPPGYIYPVDEKFAVAEDN